jgi:hypothetical protein
MDIARALFHLTSDTLTHSVTHEGSAALDAIPIRPEPGSMHFRQLPLCSYSPARKYDAGSIFHRLQDMRHNQDNEHIVYCRKSSGQEITSDSCQLFLYIPQGCTCKQRI